MINEEVRHIIEPELVEGEELLWAGKPAQGLEGKKTIILIYRAIARLFIFSLAIISLLSFIYSVLSKLDLISVTSTSSTDVLLYTAPILLVTFSLGFIFITKRCDFAFEITESIESEVYGITQDRGLIISPYFERRVRVISSSDLKKHKLSGKGIGILSFPACGDTSNDALVALKYGYLFKFYNIKNPNFVSELIHQKF